jgi:hypothetical protein
VKQRSFPIHAGGGLSAPPGHVADWPRDEGFAETELRISLMSIKEIRRTAIAKTKKAR